MLRRGSFKIDCCSKPRSCRSVRGAGFFDSNVAASAKPPKRCFFQLYSTTAGNASAPPRLMVVAPLIESVLSRGRQRSLVRNGVNAWLCRFCCRGDDARLPGQLIKVAPAHVFGIPPNQTAQIRVFVDYLWTNRFAVEKPVRFESEENDLENFFINARFQPMSYRA